MKVRYDAVQCHVVRPAANESWEFLQLLRSPGRYMANTWQLVAGGINENEPAWQAALRELREETSLVPTDFFQLNVLNSFYMAACDAVMHCPGFCAIVDAKSEVKLNDEHLAIRWTPREAIEKALMWPGERDAVRELCREILDDGPAKPYMRIAIPGS